MTNWRISVNYTLPLNINALLFQEFCLTCPALGKRGLVTGGCGAGTVAVGAGGLLRIPGAETACAWVIGGIPGRGTGGGIPAENLKNSQPIKKQNKKPYTVKLLTLDSWTQSSPENLGICHFGTTLPPTFYMTLFLFKIFRCYKIPRENLYIGRATIRPNDITNAITFSNI